MMAAQQGGLFGKYTPFWKAVWEGWHFRRDLGKKKVVNRWRIDVGKVFHDYRCITISRVNMPYR